MDVDPLRRGIAEFVGAFALIFVGAGASITSGGGSGVLGVALAHGLVIAVMASAVGHISGGHFNPAVTLAFLVTRRMSPMLAITYWIAQFAGAISGALLLWWIFPSEADPANLGAPQLNEAIGHDAGFAVEAILTFFLVWVIFATAADPRGAFKSIAGLAIGLTITLDVLMGGPLTGAAMNPARAFGPELVAWFWTEEAWIYYAGPFVGAAVAGILYEYLYLRPPRPAAVGPRETGLEEPTPGHAAAD